MAHTIEISYLRGPFSFPFSLLSFWVDCPIRNSDVALHESLKLLSFEKFLDRVVQAKMAANIFVSCNSILPGLQKLYGVLHKYQSLWFSLNVEPAIVKSGSQCHSHRHCQFNISILLLPFCHCCCQLHFLQTDFTNSGINPHALMPESVRYV